MPKFQLKRVESKKDWQDFIEVPWGIYGNDPNWVPPLRIAVKDLLDVNKNPFFKHAYLYPIVAYQEGKPIARIAGVVDDVHNKFHEETTGFFGFFECPNDQELANALLDEVAQWVKSRGMNVLRGPMNPSTNHECALLIDGFDSPPTVMMTYNPPYYATLIEKYGLSKAKDLFAFDVDSKRSKFNDRLIAHAERLKQRGKVKFRNPNMSKFEEEIDSILTVYNDAWEKNWGFVPLNREEFHHLAKDMKMVLNPKLLYIAEIGDEVVGFSLALPDVHQAQIKIKDGKLFPTGLIKLLWGLKGPAKKQINRCRVITLGIKKKYQTSGIGALLYLEYLKEGPANGYPVGEASWILEDNPQMIKALENMGAFKTKTYRIYDKRI